MRVLVVYCHPVPESFCAALRDTAIAAVESRGCEARVVDLYAENFDPVMRGEERRTYNDKAPADPALAAHIAHLRWAEAILFIYPTWWYGLPAMLKGWLDRVWAKDVAFDLSAGGAITPLMTHIKRIVVVTTCGAPWWWTTVIGHPGRRTILRGIRALCARNWPHAVPGALPDGRLDVRNACGIFGESAEKAGAALSAYSKSSACVPTRTKLIRFPSTW